MAHSAEEKIKILYEDSLKDIRELTGRMEAISELVVGASQRASEAQVVAFERNEAQLQSYQAALAEQINRLPEALTRVAAGFASELKAIATDQRENLIKANQAAITDMQRHALSLRNKVAKDIADDVQKTWRSESNNLAAVVDKYGPALDSYTERVAALTRNLGGAADGMGQKMLGAHAGAVKAMETAIDTKVSNIRDYLWGFVAVAAGVGAVVGGVVVAALK